MADPVAMVVFSSLNLDSLNAVSFSHSRASVASAPPFDFAVVRLYRDALHY